MNSLPAAILLTCGCLVLQAISRIAKSGLSTDVIWNVQVLRRLLEGETLYRDVFFGAGPLSMYVLRILAAAGLGAEALAVLLVSLAAQMAVIALCLAIARCAGVQPLLGLGLGILAAGYPWIEPSYTPIALAFLALAAFLTVRFAEARRAEGRAPAALPFLAGAAAGACFCAKQSLGLLALLAACLACAGRRPGDPRTSRASLPPIAAGFVSAVVVLFLPVVAAGSLAGFLDYGFTGKTRYLSLSGLSYLGEWRAAGNPHAAAVFLAPVVGAILCLAAWPGSSANRRIAFPLLLFSGAAVGNAFPRADFWHLNGAVPFLWTAVAVSWSGRFPRARGPLPGSALLLVLAAACLAPLHRGFRVIRADGAPIRGEKHVRWLPLGERFIGSWRQSASALPPATAANAFLLFADASRYYLAAGIENPTPFDYPLATAFGGAGERETRERIRRGEIPQVVVGTRYPEAELNATLLLDFVEAEMQEAGSRGPFRLYTLPEAPATAGGDPGRREAGRP